MKVPYPLGFRVPARYDTVVVSPKNRWDKWHSRDGDGRMNVEKRLNGLIASLQPRVWRKDASMKKIFLAGLAILLSVSVLRAADTLDMYVIDTEGGKALLLVAPTGASMLIDTGF